ncbi:MAG: ATP synthase F1 subunit gamma [Deltaproteobacteria bacterium CG_4_10_14_3_um_filter_60_8]|nr:MAG: ATP synthase F1 subunit gamma [Desulfobacterales bacterium CG2_30_60_27]PIP42943.1 MAG: ATP synthase F1 subunit gamma [Deltaproteobacteria bacterium CG23_combo_of_CG06-09_8_20_14_all_60_8]PIY22555.1 MAG: ATP synthase F1 subunit gamma [Deltaproteobacteria bacterium CG_4_10_14_3_um_filter_60_8]
MASLKDVKTQISGVKKTSQITKAMNMVAAAKLRGAQQKMENFRPYTEKFTAAMSSLAAGMNVADFPLMQAREAKTVEIVVITSDRGLCGSFNANIMKRVQQLTRQLEGEGKQVSYVCVGKKANNALKRGGKVRKAYTDIMGTFQMFNARQIVQDLAANFLANGADEVRLVYSRFISVASQKPTDEILLPVQPLAGETAQGQKGGDYIYEPSTAEIMEVLLPLFLNVMVYHAMLEVGASEHAARMSAMDNATTACKDIIANLTKLYNKARQSGITSELMDIVGGAEALKG